jgi:hypothetical protein
MSTNYGDIFNSGWDRGAALANQWDENRRRKAVARGMQGLDAATTTAPTTAQTTEYNSSNARLAAEDNRTFGIANSADDYQYGEAKLAAPRGLGDVERNRRAEQLHREQGFSREAERYGERADTAKRQEGLDIRQAKVDARQDKVDATADANQRLQAALTKAVAEGQALDVQQIHQIAQETGGDPAAGMALVAKQLGITADLAKAEVAKTEKDLGQAIASGLPALNAYVRAHMPDPDTTDNIVPEVRKTANGYQVMYGDQPLPGTAENYSSLQDIGADMMARAKGDPYGHTLYRRQEEKYRQGQEDRLLKNAHTKATTRSANASADHAGKGGVVINMGSSPQDMAGGGQGVVVTDKGRGTAVMTPLAGAPNRVREADTYVKQFEMKPPPGGKFPMLYRRGTNEMASEEEEKAYNQSQVLLRQQGPGLR